MSAELRSQEKFLNEINQIAKRFDFVAFYNFIHILRLKKYEITFFLSKNLSIEPELVNNIKFDMHKKKASITLNFRSFFGQQGVLNDYLLEKIMDNKNQSLPEFLNIYYNRLSILYFQSRQVFYPYYSKQIYNQVFGAVSGFTEDEDRDFLPFTKYFIGNYRATEQLQELLFSFTGMKAIVTENTGKKINLDMGYQAVLRRGDIYNGEKIIGRSYLDRDGAIDITFFPITETHMDWFKNIKKSTKLKRLIDKFINARLRYKTFIQRHKTMQVILKQIDDNPYHLAMGTYICLYERVTKRKQPFEIHLGKKT